MYVTIYDKNVNIKKGITNGIITFVFSYKAFSNLVVSIILFITMTIIMWLNAECLYKINEQKKDKKE